MIMRGDCLEVLHSLEESSVDSLITDPPAGISFMGKVWDDDKGGRTQWISWLTEVMTECNRVLKPGGHALVWAIPRTSHWTMTAVENAGFEIRDVVTHLFGSGFPKSLDVSKAIDKVAGAEREAVGTYKRPDGTKRNYDEWSGKKETDLFDTSSKITTIASTPEAKQWQGFGTALKPAAEFWVLARKPLSEKTVAANVLKWGTGALNIDASRIGSDIISTHGGGDKYAGIKGSGNDGVGEYKTHTGRFPANLVFSHTETCTDEQCDLECAVKLLDEQGGERPSGYRANPSTQSGSKFQSNKGVGERGFKDSGGASRFFYVAKASKFDKGENNTHPTVKASKLMSYLIKLITPPGGIVLDPFMGSGSTGIAAKREGFKFIGIEKEKEYFEIAKNRIQASNRRQEQAWE